MNNQYMMDNLIRQRDRIDDMLKNYQNVQTPMNVFNVGNNTIDFEAKIINKDEKPKDIIVSRRTAFICFDNCLLTIKETNGDIKEYKIEIPKTPEQIENEELKRKVENLERQLKERSRK